MDEQTLVGQIVKHRNGLEALLRALAGDPQPVEDLYQEVVLVMTRRREQLADPEGFRPWARAIALNVVRDYWKKRARRRELCLDQAALEALGRAFDGREADYWAERREALAACLERQPEANRRLLQLRYGAEQPLDEIGRLLSRSRHAVETALYRARLALQECVARRLRRAGAEAGPA